MGLTRRSARDDSLYGRRRVGYHGSAQEPIEVCPGHVLDLKSLGHLGGLHALARPTLNISQAGFHWRFARVFRLLPRPAFPRCRPYQHVDLARIGFDEKGRRGMMEVHPIYILGL